MSKIRFSFVVILVSIVLMIIPASAANQNFSSPGTVNASSNAHYFITIDPIGNHSVSDVFFVNGTTNLPVGDILLVQGIIDQFRPGPSWGGSIHEYISVEPGYGGVNVWSCNLSPVLWKTSMGFAGVSQDIKDFVESDDYVVVISENSTQHTSRTVYSNQFTISSSNSAATSNVSQISITPVTTILPSPSPVTVNITPNPPTPSLPLSGILPVLAITTMAVVWLVNKRRQG